MHLDDNFLFCNSLHHEGTANKHEPGTPVYASSLIRDPDKYERRILREKAKDCDNNDFTKLFQAFYLLSCAIFSVIAPPFTGSS